MSYLITAVAQGGKLVSGTSLTLAKIYENEESTISFLRKNGAEKEIQGLFLICLKELWTHADTMFTSESINELAYLIMNQYPHHRPQELIIVIKNGLSGNYGKSYGKITTMEVMRWMKEYEETDRAQFFEAKGNKPKEDWRLIDPDLLKDIVKTEKKVEQKVERKQTEGEKLIQGWMRDFDKLSRQQGTFDGAISFVEIEGEKMTIEQYLNYKLNTFEQ